MTPNLQLTIQLIAMILGIAASLTCGVVLWNLKLLNEKINQNTKDIKAVNNQRAGFTRDFTSKEDWVRSEGYTRKELKEITATLNRMEGKLDVTEKLPAICGQIAREIITKINGERS